MFVSIMYLFYPRKPNKSRLRKAGKDFSLTEGGRRGWECVWRCVCVCECVSVLASVFLDDFWTSRIQGQAFASVTKLPHSVPTTHMSAQVPIPNLVELPMNAWEVAGDGSGNPVAATAETGLDSGLQLPAWVQASPVAAGIWGAILGGIPSLCLFAFQINMFK